MHIICVNIKHLISHIIYHLYFVTVIKLKIHKIRPEIKEYRDLLERLEYAIFSTTGSIPSSWSTRPISRRVLRVLKCTQIVYNNQWEQCKQAHHSHKEADRSSIFMKFVL